MRRKIQGIMESQQIKKLNVGYLLFYIFIPLVVGAIFTALSLWALQDDTVAMMVMVIVLCCIFGGACVPASFITIPGRNIWRNWTQEALYGIIHLKEMAVP